MKVFTLKFIGKHSESNSQHFETSEKNYRVLLNKNIVYLNSINYIY